MYYSIFILRSLQVNYLFICDCFLTVGFHLFSSYEKPQIFYKQTKKYKKIQIKKDFFIQNILWHN